MIKSPQSDLLLKSQEVSLQLVHLLAHYLEHLQVVERDVTVPESLLKGLCKRIEQVFQVWDSCRLQVDGELVTLNDLPVFIGDKAQEPVAILADIFNYLRIGGLEFTQECTGAVILQHCLSNFAEILKVGQVRSYRAVTGVLKRKGIAFLSALPAASDRQVPILFSTESEANKLTYRNVLKMLGVLKEALQSLEKGQIPNALPVYRIALNLLEVQQRFPTILAPYFFLPIAEERLRIAFMSVLLCVLVCETLDLDRRVRLQVCAEGLYYYLAAGVSGDLDTEDREKLLRRWLSNMDFDPQGALGLGFFQRISFIHHAFCGSQDMAPPMLRFLYTIRRFLEMWKGPNGERLHHRVIHAMLQSRDQTLNHSVILAIAQSLGILMVGMVVLLDDHKPVLIRGIQFLPECVIRYSEIEGNGHPAKAAHREELADKSQVESFLARLKTPLAWEHLSPHSFIALMPKQT